MPGNLVAGITLSKRKDCRTAAYLDSLEKAGFSYQELYPCGQGPELGELRLHALVLTGGGDVHPSSYDEKECCCKNLDTRRDCRELTLLKWAREKRIPVLGICRGMQVLNVFMHGTLCQDIKPDTAKPHVPHHDCGPEYRHAVDIKDGSFLAAAFCSLKLSVNSRHHQAIKELGAGLRAVGWAEDCIIEAVEANEGPMFGVQWHPERLGDEGQRLFRWFYEICSNR
jgi:putative glutamine amidotransferase